MSNVFFSLRGFVKNNLNKNSVTKPDYRSVDMNDESLVGPNDREEDGFLVVGETRREKMAIRTSEFNSQSGLQAPPTYSQVSPPDEELPTYRVAMERGMSITETQSATASTLEPIAGVPFVLSPPLALQYEIIQSDLFSETFIPKTFMWSKYQYDFNFERSYLQDSENSVNNNCDLSQNEISYSEDLIQL